MPDHALFPTPTPASTDPIPFIDLAAQRRRLEGRIEAALLKVVAHGAYIMGPEVGELETRLAAFAGARHAIGCSSGTDSLLLILMAWGIGPGDAVFVPSFTFAATANVVARLGAVPIFCDIDPATYTLSLESLDAGVALASRLEARPAAVIPVDLFGQPADYAAIRTLARRHGLRVLADAAQSFGAELDGWRVGTLAEATATSFFPAKPLGGLGDGGAIITDDDELARRCASLRAQGAGKHKYDIRRIGINGRLDTLQAAVLIEKLAIFEEELAARRAIAARYDASLAGRVQLQARAAGATSTHAQYTIAVPDGVPGGRSGLAARMAAGGVPTAVHYPLPLHRQEAFAEFPRSPTGLTVSEALAQRALSLPMHPYLDPPTQARIVQTLIEAIA